MVGRDSSLRSLHLVSNYFCLGWLGMVGLFAWPFFNILVPVLIITLAVLWVTGVVTY